MCVKGFSDRTRKTAKTKRNADGDIEQTFKSLFLHKLSTLTPFIPLVTNICRSTNVRSISQEDGWITVTETRNKRATRYSYTSSLFFVCIYSSFSSIPQVLFFLSLQLVEKKILYSSQFFFLNLFLFFTFCIIFRTFTV